MQPRAVKTNSFGTFPILYTGGAVRMSWCCFIKNARIKTLSLMGGLSKRMSERNDSSWIGPDNHFRIVRQPATHPLTRGGFFSEDVPQNSAALLLALPPRQLRERVRTKQTERLRICLPKWHAGWG
jgi:hypothetical protein